MVNNDAFAWTPSKELVASSNLTAFLMAAGESSYETLVRHADRDPAWLMDQVFRFCDVRFYRPYDTMLDLSAGLAHARWCIGGTTNLVLNCIDKHRGTPVWEQTFMVWEGENPEESRTISYRELDQGVCRLAAALRSLGIGVGDVVALYMPNIPEAFVAFFATLKLGAILMPLFSGFGPDPIMTRLRHGEAKVVLTSDGTWRRGKPEPLKSVLDKALEQAPTVRHVVVVRRMGMELDAPMQRGRDLWYDELIADQAPDFETVEMPAEAPAILLYTSGTTGKPKGCIWTHIGFLGAMVTRDIRICGDFRPSDRFFFMSDMGWMVGAMCACIPSSAGASLLIAEGIPDFPDRGRFWRLVQDHSVTYLGVSPTLVRGLMRHGDADVEQYDLSALRMTCSGGEAWTEPAWRWFFKHVCKERLPIINICRAKSRYGSGHRRY